jgi:putative toxin-antitoxin system antitoxin component (TIGR02293 family)
MESIMTTSKPTPETRKGKPQKAAAAKKMPDFVVRSANQAGRGFTKSKTVIGAVKNSLQTGRNPQSRDSTRSAYRKSFNYFLGQSEVMNELGVVQKIHERLPTNVVEKFLGEGIAWIELEKVLIPRRTFTHRIKNNERLSVEESDRAVRIARILAQAESVFGNKDKAMNWLRSRMKKFADLAPMQLMDTDAGSRLVEEALIQIDEGFFA